MQANMKNTNLACTCESIPDKVITIPHSALVPLGPEAAPAVTIQPPQHHIWMKRHVISNFHITT